MDTLTLPETDPIALANGVDTLWSETKPVTVFDMRTTPDVEELEFSINWYCFESLVTAMRAIAQKALDELGPATVQPEVEWTMMNGFRLRVTATLAGEVMRDPMEDHTFLGRVIYRLESTGAPHMGSVIFTALMALSQQSWQPDDPADEGQ